MAQVHSLENSQECEDDVRKRMKAYWQQHCADGPTEDTMMLMNNAADIDAAERREILSYLPDFSNFKIVELGCGIGRFTANLANKGKKVTAIDFMQACIDKNQEKYGNKYGNIKYICKDVTLLQLKENGYDLIFSNWLMMYLDDSEVNELALNMYKWTCKGGYIFFRESCEGGPSGDKPRSVNPTFYRKHLYYTNLFGKMFGLELIRVCRVKCYEEMKSKTNQYVWLFQKQV